MNKRLTKILFSAFLCVLRASAVNPLFADEALPKWATAAKEAKPMTADEAKAFMKRLASFAIENHMKRDERSAQRGMMYEYWEVAKKGQFDQFVQGEALDTMHDGAWFAAAMASAYRATGDDYYKSVLSDWQLPFYCKMLNHSDELFNGKANHARPERQKTWADGKEWLLQDGERGFVPYWWDDGGSVSLERVQNKNPLPDFPAYDEFVAKGQANPKFLLSGYSLGSSNHLAQDLGVMVQGAWLLFREDPKWGKELAAAAKNLQQCRVNHGSGNIPAVVAPAALVSGDAKLMTMATDGTAARFWEPENHYTRALYAFKPGQKISCPGFADDDEYLYYSGIARAGGQLPKPLAFKLIYDAYTQPMLYRYYSDDAQTPPGISVFDLHPFYMVDGRHVDYRSDRKGPGGKPRPVGSRFGPQNMAVSGWALQALKTYPGIWEERYATQFPKDLRVYIEDDDAAPAPAQWNPGDTVIAIRGLRDGLALAGGSAREEVAITIFSHPDGKGDHAVVTVKADGTVAAVNHAGKALVVKGTANPKEKGVRFEVLLPYTVTRGQGAWATGIEHGRNSIQIGDEIRNLYFGATEAQVKAGLERELAGGLRTWEAIFDELGYIPSGIGEARWQRFSDNGGYAHLANAAAQWVMYLEGKRDWETHEIPGGK